MRNLLLALTLIVVGLLEDAMMQDGVNTNPALLVNLMLHRANALCYLRQVALAKKSKEHRSTQLSELGLN